MFVGFAIQLRYKSDCVELYGKILDYSDVVSSVKGVCKKQTEEIWNRFYPDERYDFDLAFSEAVNEKISTLEKCTNYDLVSAVKRQSPFFYQVIGNERIIFITFVTFFLLAIIFFII